MSRIDTSTFVTGLVLALMGGAFVLEAAGAWAFRWSHLALFGPAALIVVGVAVLARALAARPA